MNDSDNTVDAAVKLLNEANDADPDAMSRLISHRTPCNDRMANHPTIQVGKDGSTFLVGMLGIINGIYGTRVNGHGFVAAITNDEGEILRFEKIADAVRP